VDRLAYGRPFEQAIAAPRFHPSLRPTKNSGSPEFQTEKKTDDALAGALKGTYGWVGDVDGGTESFGGVNAVELMTDGRLRGFADQRRSNAAEGY
jgi:gamma-glutamyltranspeptidase / glutathione hydrolase